MTRRLDEMDEATLEQAAMDALEGGRAGEGASAEYLEARTAFDAVAAHVALAAAADPPESLRARVLAGLQQPRPVETLRAGVTLVRTTETEWKTAFPGVQYKEIHRDRARRSRSILYRMEPGSRFPDHDHTFLEELFVLEGSAWVTGEFLKAGDYCRSEPGTRDFGIRSEEGTTFLALLTEVAS